MTELQNVWQLPALIALPFIAGLLCWLVEKINNRLPRWIALIGMTLTFLLSIQLWQKGSFAGMSEQVIAPQTPTPWLAEYILPWIPSFGISFHLALDGLSLLMVGLTALLGIMAVGCSWNEIQRRVGFFHLNLLWSLGGVIGVFLAIDMFLFFFFWEMMLVPIYFLIAIWGHDAIGGKTKEYAATKFFIYTQASGLIMLVGILVLVIINYTQTGQVSFNYEALLGTQLGVWEYPLMLCFFIGFAVKLPIMPFHGWLPDAHAQAPTAGSVDLAGILIKTAAYGLIRFVLPLFPNASQDFAPIAMTLGTIGIFYGAWLAFMQTDVKKLLAYTSISHMGFVVLAIYAGTLLSLQGLMIQMLAHGLSSAALFIMAGQLYERMHTRDLRLMGGMWGEFRYYAPLLMFFCAALLGIPGTGNFIGEFLILMGAFAQYPVYVVLATISLVLAGLYSLILIYRALFGSEDVKQVVAQQTRLQARRHTVPSKANDKGMTALAVLSANEAHTNTVHSNTAHTSTNSINQQANAPVTVATYNGAGLENGATHVTQHQDPNGSLINGTPANKVSVKDLGKRELALLLSLAAGLIWLGLYPQPFLDTSSESMQWINNAYIYNEVSQINNEAVLHIDMSQTQEPQPQQFGAMEAH